MKKTMCFLLALALVLGLTQCKKEKPQTQGVRITLDVDGGNSKVDVNPTGGGTYATVAFENGDIIYVGNNGSYCGYLQHNGTHFIGSIDAGSLSQDDYLHFYFMGNKGTTSQPSSVNITDQTSKYPVISYAHSTVKYTSGTTHYSAKLQNYCAIVKFTTTDIAADITITGMKNTVAVDFSKNKGTGDVVNPFTYTKTGDGDITLHKVSNTERWAILLPQDEVTTATATATGYASEGTFTVPVITANMYSNTGVNISMTAVWDGDLAKITSESTEAFATATDGMTITGTLTVNKKISIAAGATVTLDNVSINADGNWCDDAWAGLTCLGNATIILSGTNTVKGFNADYPGIQAAHNDTGVGDEYTLTIQGTGSLTASSNGWGAGIGGGWGINCGNIVINGGSSIEATGGSYAAGIGGGSWGGCGDITIIGGSIIANGGGNGAGIGTGFGGTCGNITISGGSITANGGEEYAAGIGTGFNGNCGSITIYNTVTSVRASKGTDATNSIGTGYGDSCGTVTIGGTVYWGPTAADPSEYEYKNGGDSYLPTSPLVYPTPAPSVTDLATITENYTASDGEILTGILGANVKISIADGATVTLDGVSINASGTWTTGNYAGITCLGNATIILSGTNTVKGFNVDYPGIHVPAGNTLTIKDSGSLTASSNGHGAGIGGGWDIACGNIEIQGGTVMATGGNLAAGIGSGTNGSCGTITISGGTVRATGGEFGAGIGSGTSGSCGTITISGGNVTAIAGTYGYNTAAIGKSSEGTCTSVTFTPGITSLTLTNSEVFEPIGSYFINATEVYANTTPITGMLSSLPVGAITMAGFATSYDEGTKTWTITKQ